MKFNDWLDTFVYEKELDINHIFEIEKLDSIFGVNFIELGAVLDQIKSSPEIVRAKIKKNLVAIDFMNGDALHFFEFLAKRMAV